MMELESRRVTDDVRDSIEALRQKAGVTMAGMDDLRNTFRTAYSKFYFLREAGLTVRTIVGWADCLGYDVNITFTKRNVK